jgi:hypothetical protein
MGVRNLDGAPDERKEEDEDYGCRNDEKAVQ